jgi:hypothetical protein
LVGAVNGRPAGRPDARRARARGLWHLGGRALRKALSPTAAAWTNGRLGHRPLGFSVFEN